MPPVSAELRLHRRAPIGRELYGMLRRQILTGVLRPGESIPEATLAERAGVSRTPVREVLRRLADEGFVTIIPQVGTYVAPIRLAAVYDSQFIRETLECRTIRLAAENLTEADAAVLRTNLAAQQASLEAGESDAFFDQDDALHACLVRIAGRPAIWEVIQGVKSQLDRVRYLSLQSGDWPPVLVEEHATLVGHVLAGDAEGAEAAMRAHLRTVFATIERISRVNADFFEKPAP
ncbi:GntR family transcriptional regulator [Roseomonas sp. E05]|uniref:GntR family transcriptional regulator n=1 Tax=Roseomonas sp. E05 TaxID=3046310 RepID=UPI0024BBA135|nr:GntR family transcriptional regulator [Roseomonas sp. E05]MDJ0391187.1 GntR family transcriptional regulator [Roseomonas sp. E05]